MLEAGRRWGIIVGACGGNECGTTERGDGTSFNAEPRRHGADFDDVRLSKSFNAGPAEMQRRHG